MKGYLRNILIASAVLMAAVSCNKEQQPDHDGTGYPIEFYVTELGATKAMLDGTSFAKEGNLIKIYDYYTPSGSTRPQTPPYIDDQIKSNGPGNQIWPFVKQKYNWTPDGSHKFFGWLAEDKNMPQPNNSNLFVTPESFFGTDFGYANQVLTIPTTTIGQETPQFDFMYSNVHIRDLDSNPDFASAVPLEFSHLFTAFSIAAKNSSSSDIVVKSIEVKALNTNSATISYENVAVDSGLPTVTYGAGSKVESENYILEPNVRLTSSLMDMSTPLTSDRDYFLMWPKSEYDEVVLGINYTMGDDNNTIDVPVNGEWLAGEKNNLNLEFFDKKIELICTVDPWEKESEQIDYAQDVVSVSKKMTWEGVQEVDYETGEVILRSDKNAVATCSFRIDTPVGATWTASLILVNEDGSIDAFSWVDDTKYGIVGTGHDSVIKLKVNNNAPKAPQHICILRITVQTSDMRTIVVNDLVPETYTDDHGIEHSTNGYTEFRIIQNDILG